MKPVASYRICIVHKHKERHQTTNIAFGISNHLHIVSLGIFESWFFSGIHKKEEEFKKKENIKKKIVLRYQKQLDLIPLSVVIHS